MLIQSKSLILHLINNLHLLLLNLIIYRNRIILLI